MSYCEGISEMDVGMILAGLAYSGWMLYYVTKHNNPTGELKRKLDRLSSGELSKKEAESFRRDNGLAAVPKWYWQLWGLMIFSCLWTFLAARLLCKDGGSNYLEKLLVGELQDRISGMFESSAAGFAVHVFYMPLAIHAKKRKVIKQGGRKRNRSSVVPNGKTVIFSVKYTCCQKIFNFFIGFVLNLVEHLITNYGDYLPFVGGVLQAMWIPGPFWKFHSRRQISRNIRVKGARLELTCGMADAYFMDLDMMLKMFYTLNAWGYWAHFVRGGPIGIYNKWLDRHLRWYSEPPYGFNNAFQLFHIKIGLCDKIKLLLLTPLGLFPFIGVVITYKQFKYTCKSMILGGSQATLDDEYTISNLFGPWFMERCCWCCCCGVVNRFVDRHLQLTPKMIDVEYDPEDNLYGGNFAQGMQQPGVQMGQPQYGQQPPGYGQQPPQHGQPQPQAGYGQQYPPSAPMQGMPPSMQAQQFQHSNSLPPPPPPASPAFAGTPGLRNDTQERAAPKPEVKFASVLEWLTSMGCEQYWDKFEEDGYDDMDTIVDLTSEDLAELGVEKKGHLIKITKSLKKMTA